jgi:acyl-CoA oxidase
MLRSIWYREVGHRVSSSARGLSVGKVCEKNYGNITTQSLKEWGADFKRATVDLALMDVNQISYEESSQRLRSLLRSGLLKHTDLLYNPERFFLAHRILAEHATQLGPGFWIRFTVHYNLCMGSILGLGNSEQVKLLDKYQEGGLLGCFSLTEKFAGVNSGMVVNTIAEYSKTRGTFTLRSPEEGAKKNWISQGLVADMTVAVADLHIEGNSFGPHAFLVEMRRDGQLSAGITVGDMGKKTVGNDLDNAWISFNNVELPKSALLNRFGDIDDHGQYVQKVKGMPVFHMIGQRLFTGRVAVAQAAYEFRRKLFETTRAYTDTKRVWSPSGPDHIYLSTIPQVKALYEEEKLKGQKTMAFLDKCEAELCTALRSNNLPSIELVQAIAVAKVLAVGIDAYLPSLTSRY